MNWYSDLTLLSLLHLIFPSCQRRLKQLKFESQMKSLQQAHQAQAHRTRQRCLQQSRHLRDKYDHLENEAERALRRRKQIRTSSDLYIHEEIQQRKQEYRRIS